MKILASKYVPSPDCQDRRHWSWEKYLLLENGSICLESGVEDDDFQSGCYKNPDKWLEWDELSAEIKEEFAEAYKQVKKT